MYKRKSLKEIGQKNKITHISLARADSSIFLSRRPVHKRNDTITNRSD